MTSNRAAVPDSADTPISHRTALAIFSALLLAMFLSALDQTIVATALPTIAGELGGLANLPWIVTVYLLASTASTPIWGKVSDMYGRRIVFLVVIAVFLVGSTLCGLAQNVTMLIAFRALQGLGAGGIMTLAMTMVADLFPPRERGRYQGLIQAVFTVASIVGPLLGGVLIDHASWRWVFYVNVPIGIVAWIVVAVLMKTPSRTTQHSIDFAGAAVLMAGVVSLMLVTVWGGQRYSWTSPLIITLAVAGVALLVGFVLREQRAAEPILPMRLFRDPVFVVVSITLFASSCALFSALVFLPVFLQIVTGANATRSGLLLVPMMIGVTVASLVSGYLVTRWGRYKIFPILGLTVITVALFLLSQIGTSTSRADVSAAMVLFGIGFGLVTQVLIVAIQNAVPRADIGTATASANFSRALGGAVGVSVFGAVFSARLSDRLARTLPAGHPAGLDAGTIQSSPQQIRAMPVAIRDVLTAGVSHAVNDVFLVAAPIAAVGLIAVLFLKEYPLAGRGDQGGSDREPGQRAQPGRTSPHS